MHMELNKEEFKTLVMLYAANIDGKFQSEEMEVLLEKTDATTFKKMSKIFKTLSDVEIIDCIHENKSLFAATESDRQQLMNDFHSIILADEKCTPMEKYLLKNVEKILK